ncbi:DUF317 domain-containing protein [Streptomyces nigrescens]|uniref:DUF317 domain-containing protein n=1 Tax=Streptomyces nigrescens TaxID=1920 RepID=A0ABY7IXK3_STRNI|nr:DUF317 domain-containing protein [Streptomyces nigrescens]WAU03035.1 DUF317 domain-containing protein [Streptomyces nigrescens]
MRPCSSCSECSGLECSYLVYSSGITLGIRATQSQCIHTDEDGKPLEPLHDAAPLSTSTRVPDARSLVPSRSTLTSTIQLACDGHGHPLAPSASPPDRERGKAPRRHGGELWRINVKGADGATAWHQGFGPDTPAQAVAGFLAALISSRSRYYDCIWHIGLQAPAAVLETGRQVWEASAMAAIGGVPPHLDCFPGSPSLHLLSCCRADGWLPSSHRPGSKWKPLPLVLASPQAL